MKKFTISLILFFCLGWLVQSQPQWGWPQDFGANYSTRFNTFSFIDEDTGWLSGNFGVIWKTTDGGVSWTPQTSGTARYLNGIHFVSETHGWAAGEAGTILGTTNGGSSWTTQLDLGGTNHLNSIFFPSNTAGWAVGNGGRVMNTTDGGENWTQITGLPVGTNILRSVFFVNETHGWIVGNGGTIIATTDGGETWDAQTSGVSSILYAVNFANATHGWVVGAGGLILATNDGGETWSEQDSEITTNLNTVSFASASKGWAAGNDGVVLATVDGGETWTEQESNVGGIINGITFVSETKGFAAGQAGLILTTLNGGSNWEGVGYGTASALNSIYFATNHIGYFVGAGGTIMKTENGGFNWMYDNNTEITTSLNSVHFPTPDKGWIVGHNGVILHKSGSRNSWVEQDAPEGFTANLNSVFFINETHGWAVGASGKIIATTDGGATWVEQTSGLGTNAINSVFFVNQTHGWAVGVGGKIIHTTDGGANWVEQTANAGTNILRSVFFISETQGWVVGNGGTIRTTVDGGETWNTQVSGLTNILSTVFFASPTHGWAAGAALGNILYTTDGGETWAVQHNIGSLGAINSLFFNSQSNGYGVGAQGMLLLYGCTEVPEILTTTPDETCGEGEVTLMATASAGNIKWYDAGIGGMLLGEGGSLTQTITETTSFWVEAEDQGCVSQRVEVIGTFKEIPEILTVTPGETCGTTASITATASAGTINWYDAETGGNLIGFGGSLNVGLGAPVSTFWVEVENNGCVSGRIEAGTFFLKPIILSTTSDDICGGGEVTLLATASLGTIKWYDSETGGTLLGTGGTLTQNITETTNFWVEADNEGCVSQRDIVTGIVKEIPQIISTTPDSTCGEGVVTLMATSSVGTIKWYAAQTGDALLGEGGSLTQTITETTSFWVEADNDGCLSDRVEVVGSVLPLPNNAVTRDDFVLTANQAGATYKWLDCNNSFAEISGQTGQSFTVTQNGSYAVEVTLGQCSVISDCVVINNVGIVSPDEVAFKVFPNPTQNVVNIEVSAEYVGLTFSVFDRIGRVVKKGILDSQVNTFDIGNLPNGLYFLIIDSNQKQLKIIKQ